MPKRVDLTWEGLDFSAEKFFNLMQIDQQEGIAETEAQKELFERYGDRLPAALEEQRRQVLERLRQAPPVWKLAS